MGIRLEAEPLEGEFACPVGSDEIVSGGDYCFRMSEEVTGIGENEECTGVSVCLGGGVYAVVSDGFSESMLSTPGDDFKVAAPDELSCSAMELTVKALPKLHTDGFIAGGSGSAALYPFNDDPQWYEYQILDGVEEDGDLPVSSIMVDGDLYYHDGYSTSPGHYELYTAGGGRVEITEVTETVPVLDADGEDTGETMEVVTEVEEIVATRYRHSLTTQEIAPDRDALEPGFQYSETLVLPAGERGADRWSITDIAGIADAANRVDYAGDACASRTEPMTLHQNLQLLGGEVAVEYGFDESLLKQDGATFKIFATFFCSTYSVEISQKDKACPDGYFYNAQRDICLSLVEYTVELDADRESEESGEPFTYTQAIYGLRVYNQYNQVMLDADMKQFHYYGKASYNSEIFSGTGYGGVRFMTYDIFLSRDIFPLIFIKPADYGRLHAIVSLRTVGSGHWVCDLMVGGGVSTSAIAPPELYVFVTPDAVEEPGDRYGLQTRLSSGEVSFDSRRKPLVVMDGVVTSLSGTPNVGTQDLTPSGFTPFSLNDAVSGADDLMFSIPGMAHAEREYTIERGDTWCFPCCSCKLYTKWWKSVDVYWAFYRAGYGIYDGELWSGWVTFLSGHLHRRKSGSGFSLFGLIDIWDFGERNTSSGTPPLRNDNVNVGLDNFCLITRASRYE